MAIDISQGYSWENSLAAHVDDLPFQLIGKGEQNALKTLLAIGQKAAEVEVVLIEEPETHLSFGVVEEANRTHRRSVLDLLMKSSIRLTFVGDPRQHTFSTNIGSRNKKYRGIGFLDWIDERSAICQRETRECSYRCNQLICDFADAIYPTMPNGSRTGSMHTN